MSSIETDHSHNLHCARPPHRDAGPFLGRARVGESRPIHVEPIPGASAVAVVHPGRSERIAPIPPGSKLEDLVDDYKLAIVHQALAQSGGNHRRAAALIGIHRSSFTRMLHRLEGACRARSNAATSAGAETQPGEA